MSGKYFNIGRDKELPCFCEGCLVGKTEEQMSPKDIRYCVECQQFIEQDFEGLGRLARYRSVAPQSDIETVETVAITSCPYAETETKMSTLNQESATVDKFRPRGRPKTYKKRNLPVEEIQQLHQNGLGSKAIATRLNKENGIDVSYKTIQRVLSGQRK